MRRSHVSAGSTVAKFAGQNVHKRLIEEESYKEGKYDEALKRAFLGTDEDLLASQSHYPSFFFSSYASRGVPRSGTQSGSFGLHGSGGVGDDG